MFNTQLWYSDVRVPGNLPQGSLGYCCYKVLRQAEDGDFVFVRFTVPRQNWAQLPHSLQ